ncbi:hypothetical protein M5689_004882 [Euphorbia peplus]|nr:hypothetical protein M5689_004882 [Euphorbia peplus]
MKTHWVVSSHVQMLLSKRALFRGKTHMTMKKEEEENAGNMVQYADVLCVKVFHSLQFPQLLERIKIDKAGFLLFLLNSR